MQFLATIAAATGNQVTLVAGTLAHVVPNGQTARVEIQLATNGGEIQDQAGGGLQVVGKWLRWGSNSDFEVRFNATGQPTNVGSPINTWVDLASTVSFGLNLAVSNTEWNTAGTLEVRRKAGGAIIASEPLTLSVIVGTP